MLNKKTYKLSTKFKRSTRAISPVIATLLMIAIAVAASLVAYAWIMGYIGNTTDTAGRSILIQSVAKDSAGEITVYVQNTGDSVVTLGSIYVDDVIIDNPVFQDDNKTVNPGATKSIGLGVPSLADPAGAKANIKVYTSTGTFFEYKKTFTSTSGGGSGATPTPTAAPPPTVTRVQNSVTSFTAAPTQNDFLVVIAGHRVQDTDTPVDPTMTGWDLAGIVRYKSAGYTNDRRVLAVFTKTAGAGESTTPPTVNWGTSGGSSAFVICQAFRGATTYTKVTPYGTNSAGLQGSAGSPTYATSPLAVPSSPLSIAGNNVLSIGAMVWRDDSTTITSATFSGLSTETRATTTTTCPGATAFAYGAAVTQTSVSWTPTVNDMASGLLIAFTCS